jgi:23S rRNA pseudouridine2605 synthase
MRVAKAISDSGVCSRRAAEKLILEGKVSVNGVFIESPALNILDTDIIEVDGHPIAKQEKLRLWLYYKPVGQVTTHKDPENRPTVFDNLPKNMPRVISIGRLDINSEGLLLLTNSGEFARKMELPSSKIERSYKVRCFGTFNIIELQKAEKGITIDGEFFHPKKIELIEKGINSWVRVILTEGKNREIRKIFAHFGLKISKLVRVSYGEFKLGKMQPGEVVEATISI